MSQLRIALAQFNPTVGDLTGNAAHIRKWTEEAARAGARVVVFPEMALTGYPVEDLSSRRTFAEASRQAVTELASSLRDAGNGTVLAYVGYLDHDESGPRNAVAAIHGGRVVATQFKHHLPNYGVFDERRFFRAGRELRVLRFGGLDIGVVVCEDLWQEGGPVAALGAAGVDLIVAVNASPYERSKSESRVSLVARQASEAGAPIAYANLCGGQDDLAFDGDSMIVGTDGGVLARAPQFAEHLLLADLALTGGGYTAQGDFAGMSVHRHELEYESSGEHEPRAAPISEPLSEEAQMWSALVCGLRDYANKNGFPSVVLGLSGGIDSAVCAAIATDALGAEAVHGVSMPSRYSSEHSRTDAAALAGNLGCHLRVEPVADMVAAYVDQLALTGLAEENIQARVRGMLLMAVSNMEGHLVLAPGNKTELAVGYSTLYGDAVGGFAPIKDVFKTQVWHLARWRNAEAARRGRMAPIPEASIDKAPSAELRPGQVDADSLPDYALLDDVLDRYVERDQGYTELLDGGFEPALIERVIRMVDGAEYKRRQYPPGTKVTSRAFGRDRRLPMTNAWRETH